MCDHRIQPIGGISQSTEGDSFIIRSTMATTAATTATTALITATTASIHRIMWPHGGSTALITATMATTATTATIHRIMWSHGGSIPSIVAKKNTVSYGSAILGIVVQKSAVSHGGGVTKHTLITSIVSLNWRALYPVDHQIGKLFKDITVSILSNEMDERTVGSGADTVVTALRAGHLCCVVTNTVCDLFHVCWSM